MRRKSKVLTVACGVALAGALAACSAAGQSQAATPSHPPAAGALGTLVDAVAEPTVTLDPMFTTNESTSEIDSEVFDELVTYGKNYNIVPDLATSWTQTGNGLDWTFKLHSGVKFSDGQPLSGTDVVASLDRFMAVGTGGNTMAALVKSVTSPSAYIVKVDLKKPDEDFPAMIADPLTFIAIMPAKYADSRKELAPPDLIGTGPYAIKTWNPDQDTLLQRNRYYVPLSSSNVGGFGGSKVAYYQQLEFEVVSNAQSRLLGLESGQFQYAEELPFSDYQTVAANSSLKPEINSSGGYIVVFYANNYQYPTDNVWFRRAMALALNDTDIMKFITSDESRFYQLNGSGLFYPVQSEFYNPSLSAGVYNHPDPAEVKADLKKAGYKGQPLVILTNQQYEWMYQAAETAVAELKADGINAEADVTTWSSQVTYTTKKTGFGLFTSGNALRFDPADQAQDIGAGGDLDWGFDNAQINSLLNAYNHAANATTQRAITNQLQKAYWETLPELTVGDMAEFDAASTSLHGYSLWYIPRFWNVW